MPHRQRIGIDRLATALRHRATGASIPEACAAAGIASKSSWYFRRDEFGREAWDGVVEELRHLAADGWGSAALGQRARQLLLGREADAEILASQDHPLTWAALVTAAQRLFSGKAGNARGEKAGHFEHLASDAYWIAARARVEDFLGQPANEAEPAQLLRALWATARGIEIAP